MGMSWSPLAQGMGSTTRRYVLMLTLVGVVLAGCAGASESAGDGAAQDGGSEPATSVASSPGTASADCGELADEVIAQLQVIIDELSAASLNDVLEGDVLSAESQQQLDELERRVEDAGCDDDEMDTLLAERADSIQGEGEIAEAVRDGLRQGEDLPF